MQSLSETDICNQALAAAQVRAQIASMNDSNTSARACKLFYATARDELLREAQWGFANKYSLLELKATYNAVAWDAAGPGPGWAYQYGYPVDCAKMNYIIPLTNFQAWMARLRTNERVDLKTVGAPWELTSNGGETRINTNAEQAVGAYTEQVNVTSRWTPEFAAAMVARLAYRIAVPLSGDKQIAAANYQLSQSLAAKAMQGDGNEGLTVIDHVPDWQAARDSWGIDSWPGFV